MSDILLNGTVAPNGGFPVARGRNIAGKVITWSGDTDKPWSDVLAELNAQQQNGYPTGRVVLEAQATYTIDVSADLSQVSFTSPIGPNGLYIADGVLLGGSGYVILAFDNITLYPVSAMCAPDDYVQIFFTGQGCGIAYDNADTACFPNPSTYSSIFIQGLSQNFPSLLTIEADSQPLVTIASGRTFAIEATGTANIASNGDQFVIDGPGNLTLQCDVTALTFVHGVNYASTTVVETTSVLPTVLSRAAHPGLLGISSNTQYATDGMLAFDSVTREIMQGDGTKLRPITVRTRMAQGAVFAHTFLKAGTNANSVAVFTLGDTDPTLVTGVCVQAASDGGIAWVAELRGQEVTVGLDGLGAATPGAPLFLSDQADGVLSVVNHGGGRPRMSVATSAGDSGGVVRCVFDAYRAPPTLLVVATYSALPTTPTPVNGLLAVALDTLTIAIAKNGNWYVAGTKVWP